MALFYAPPSPHGHQYYEASQLAAFAIYVGLLLAQGYRRGYPWRNWLPLVAASTLALVVGCQLVFLPPAQWLGWLRGDADLVRAVAEGPRAVVGGAAASLGAVLALRRALGFRGWAVLDAFAGPLCWALAAQCVGCLLVGCCWGEVTTGGLGLVYGPGTLPYLAQQAQGLLPAGAGQSLPLVPTQLYHLLLCAGTGLVLHFTRRKANWPGGSRYLLAMGLLCLGRFGVEFWRDPAGEPLLAAPVALAGGTLLGLQWLLLLDALLLLGGWAWLAAGGHPARPPAGAVAPTAYPGLVGLGLLVATSRLGRGTLTAPEVLVLQAVLLAVLLAEGWALLPGLARRAPRLAGLPLSLLLGGALLLATAQAPAPPRANPAADEPAQTVTVSVGLLGNSHDAAENILDTHQGCSGSTPMLLHQQVRAGGAEVAVPTNRNLPAVQTVGGGVWVGRQTVDALTLPSGRNSYRLGPDTTLHYTLVDAHLYVQGAGGHDWLTFGYRAGVHIGDLGHYSYFADGNTAGPLHFLPELMLSLGNPRLLYGQADFGYGAENALGACTSRLALGSGLGQATGRQVLAGLAHSAHTPSRDMGFVSANLRLPGRSALSLEPYFATDFGRHQVFSLKLNYYLRR